MDTEQLDMELTRIETSFAKALSEFIRQAGYIEGTLDTLISITMELNPEVSITADRLVKTFRGIEGVCTQGIKVEFQKLLDLCRELHYQLEDSKVEANPLSNLDSALDALSISKGTKKNGK